MKNEIFADGLFKIMKIVCNFEKNYQRSKENNNIKGDL